MRQVVYIDEIILVNLVMNLTVLWLTSRFTGSRTSPARMVTAAMVGCIYALLIFIPGLERTAGAASSKILSALLLTYTAFGFNGIRVFAKNVFCLFLASFSVGGMSLGLYYLFEPVQWPGGEGQEPLNKWLLLSCVVLLSYLIGKWGSMLWLKRMQQKKIQVPITVVLWGNRVSAEALVDTGNQLIDPVSGHPVIVVELGVLQPALPESLSTVFQQGDRENGAQRMLLLAETPYAGSLRLIPFKSLGEENGMLLGVRPDSVEIVHENRRYVVTDVVIGIYSKRLSPEAAYRALLHPQLLAS
ncbi:sigma-E processing peptidase SpoIIGA [Desulforamulus ruminis]|uniref:sigma-E processing peptidase SpoIIGA n=1 Tax=Desulforamulus ruminis TaxID=1564 RepID=UPI002FD89DD5